MYFIPGRNTWNDNLSGFATGGTVTEYVHSYKNKKLSAAEFELTKTHGAQFNQVGNCHYWARMGLLHRTDGPAVQGNSVIEYWLDGCRDWRCGDAGQENIYLRRRHKYRRGG